MNSAKFENLNGPFRSFWMGGFECADHLNVHGNRVNLLQLTRHLEFIHEDYRLLKQFNIKTVREGICWSLVEPRPYEYDFGHLDRMFRAGAENGIQQVWDICHFGFPDDLTPFHPQFKKRFVNLCVRFGEYCLSNTEDLVDIVITPINEVSFLSWLGGEAAATSPYCRGKGWDMKYALMEAYIIAVAALKDMSGRFKILGTEPLVNIVQSTANTEFELEQAQKNHEEQYQAMDMLCGRICPELGGREGYLDILGCNYYYTNQFSIGTYEVLPWTNPYNDFRFRPLSDLLSEAFYRYGKPLLLAETSHPGEDRPNWLNSVTEECSIARNNHVDLLGICLYPIIDRPDWDDTDNWHSSGLWGRACSEGFNRDICEPYADALADCQRKLNYLTDTYPPTCIGLVGTIYQR